MRLKTAVLLALVVACGKSTSDGKKAPPSAPPEQPAQPADASSGVVVLAPAPPLAPTPRGLPDPPSPTHNPTTAAKVALGEILFFDPRLSGDGKTSCATCHDPDKGWSDGQLRADTVAGKPNLRHTASLYNLAYLSHLYWDGRLATLEPLILGHWSGQLAGRPDRVAAALADIPVYAAHFQRTFQAAASTERTVEALAAFVRTIRSGDAPYDHYEVGGDAALVTPAAIAGFEVFREKAQCALCHAPPLYADGGFHSITGAGPDPGRFLVTKNQADRSTFRTPTLRGVTGNPPYFHNGSAPTLRAAILTCRAAAGGGDAEARALARDDLDNLVAFLTALSPVTAPYPRPELPGP